MGISVLSRTAVADEPSADRFHAPFRIRVDGRVLETNGLMAPELGDFDGDGRRDLLVGQHRGRMMVFRNQGTDDEPEFTGPVWFDEILPEGRIPTG